MAIENQYVAGHQIQESFLGKKYCVSLFAPIFNEKEEEVDFAYSIFCEVFDEFNLGLLEFKCKIITWVTRKNYTYIEVVEWK